MNRGMYGKSPRGRTFRTARALVVKSLEALDLPSRNQRPEINFITNRRGHVTTLRGEMPTCGAIGGPRAGVVRLRGGFDGLAVGLVSSFARNASD